MIQVFTRISRDNIGIPHIQAIVPINRQQITTKIDQRIGTAFNFQRFIGVLLRFQQCVCIIGRGKTLHQVAHDHHQLAGDFCQQLRVTLVGRYHLWERDTPPQRSLNWASNGIKNPPLRKPIKCRAGVTICGTISSSVSSTLLIPDAENGRRISGTERQSPDLELALFHSDAGLPAPVARQIWISEESGMYIGIG